MDRLSYEEQLYHIRYCWNVQAISDRAIVLEMLRQQHYQWLRMQQRAADYAKINLPLQFHGSLSDWQNMEDNQHEAH